jgi:hypothetical protein
MMTYGAVKPITAARAGSMARKAMSQAPLLTASVTLPAVS